MAHHVLLQLIRTGGRSVYGRCTALPKNFAATPRITEKTARTFIGSSNVSQTFKIQIHCSATQYPGYQVGANGTDPSPEKVSKIAGWPAEFSKDP